MKKWIFIFLFYFTNIIAQQEQQRVINSFDISIQQEKAYELTETLIETDSIATSCSSCISLLQILKKMSLFSEAFLISTLTKICKRTNKVDDDVVSRIIK